MMPPQTDKEFHDPALKEAVCRCWARDCASAELKKRISQLCGSSDSVANSAGHWRSLGKMAWAVWPVAIAASVLLAIGLLHQFKNQAEPTAIASVIPTSLENDLIFRHDFCCKLHDHQHLKVPKGDDAAIADALHATLNRPVLVSHPQDPDWQFRGAAVCPVGSTPAGHLVFVKGNDGLSIFSLPKSLLPSAVEGTDYAVTIDQHSIVAFVKDGALFCLVSSGPPGDIGIDELKTMESNMLPAVARDYTPKPSPVVLTELLRPVGP